MACVEELVQLAREKLEFEDELAKVRRECGNLRQRNTKYKDKLQALKLKHKECKDSLLADLCDLQKKYDKAKCCSEALEAKYANLHEQRDKDDLVHSMLEKSWKRKHAAVSETLKELRQDYTATQGLLRDANITITAMQFTQAHWSALSKQWRNPQRVTEYIQEQETKIGELAEEVKSLKDNLANAKTALKDAQPKALLYDQHSSLIDKVGGAVCICSLQSRCCVATIYGNVCRL